MSGVSEHQESGLLCYRSLKMSCGYLDLLLEALSH